MLGCEAHSINCSWGVPLLPLPPFTSHFLKVHFWLPLPLSAYLHCNFILHPATQHAGNLSPLPTYIYSSVLLWSIVSGQVQLFVSRIHKHFFINTHFLSQVSGHVIISSRCSMVMSADCILPHLMQGQWVAEAIVPSLLFDRHM